MIDVQATVTLRDMPSVMQALRGELAQLLREQAGKERDPHVAVRLVAIADTFAQRLSGVEAVERVKAPLPEVNERLGLRSGSLPAAAAPPPTVASIPLGPSTLKP